MSSYFEYGNTETEWLKSRDKTLGAVIDEIGHMKITPMLFTKYRRRYSPYATVAGLYL